MKKMKQQFRLPTRREFEKLNKHLSRWNEEKKGLEIENDRGDILFFPAYGYCSGSSNYNRDSHGYYWSSTLNKYDNNFAYNFSFNSTSKKKYNDFSNCFYRFSVRLVSDEPFDGGIEFDGLYWKQENENGYYSFDKATKRFDKIITMEKLKHQLRLPTKEDWLDLVENHFTKWNKEKHGLEIMNKKGDILFLSANGYKDYDDSISYPTTLGYYWSSSVHENCSNYIYYLAFSSSSRIMDIGFRDSWKTVRLVSDTPFDGSIEFNGVYWKAKNEKEYYSFDEAMKKFNKK